MEVVVSEEKKKIFRARKTMKISDRQQLETLHSTLLTPSSGSSNSPPPLMNGTHKEDGQNLEDKQESVSPNATSPASPAPGLSLSLTLSPSSSESQKTMEELPASPTSPFHSLNSELKKLENNESGPSSPALKSDILSGKKSEQTQEDHTAPVPENEAVENEATEDQAKSNSVKDSIKDSGRPLPQSPMVPADCPEPMETDNSSPKTVDSVITETETDKQTDEKSPFPPSSNEVDSSPAPVCKSDATVTEKEAEPEKKKEETTPVAQMKKDTCIEKVNSKTEVRREDTTKQARPSSTPPSNAGKDERKSSGIKRTLSEGFEPNGPCISREVKRPKMGREEYEAQLELKITAKAGNHLKLEKIVQKLVEDKLRVLEMTIFDRNLQELKDRVDQIDCMTKHHTAMNTLQAKIARLAKKFGEANQASENKKKQEALAAAAAAAAAATAAANTTPAPAAPAVKTVPSSPQTQSVHHQQAVQLEVSTDGQVPFVASTTSVHTSKTNHDKPQQNDPKIYAPLNHLPFVHKITEYSEGKCKADIQLRTISSDLETLLYVKCQRGGRPKAKRYASYIFRYLLPYKLYRDWVSKVNYNGFLCKHALPLNLRRTLRKYVEERFPNLPTKQWKEIRDTINELLRVKRNPGFFYKKNIGLNECQKS